MRVLIVGAFGTVTSAIIRKFGKEGARIYALTGKILRTGTKKYMNSMIFRMIIIA